MKREQLRKGTLVGGDEVYYNDVKAYVIKDCGDDGFEILQFKFVDDRWHRIIDLIPMQKEDGSVVYVAL